jgi:3-methyladenine DNA glycosylase Tag
MISFKEIEKQAAAHHGGIKALKQKLRVPLAKKEVLTLSNEHYLSELSKVTFQIGFNCSLVEIKWPAFEENFFGFDIALCSSLPDEALEAAMETGTIIKNWRKVKAIRSNAQWFMSIIEQHGSIGAYLSKIDADHYFEHLLEIQKGGTNVGTRTLQIWLRRLGIDAFILSMDVERVLRMYGVIDKAPSSKKAWINLQEQVNLWRAEGNYSLSNISQIMAFSLGQE